MMKKAGIILLNVIFLYSIIGVTFATHYCGGKVFGTRLVTHTDKDPCGCPSTPMKDECCKDEVLILKVKDDFVSSNNFSAQVEKNIMLLSFAVADIFNNYFTRDHQFFTGNYSPPPLTGVAIPILIQSLRF